MRRWAAIGIAAVVAAVAAIAIERQHGPAYRSPAGATLVHFTLHSRATGRDLHEVLVCRAAAAAAFSSSSCTGEAAPPRAG